MKKIKYLAIILIINLIITTTFNFFPSKVFAANQRIDNQINNIDEKKYPGIKSMIQNLQKQHPKWIFKVLYTGLDWDEVIKQESKHGRNIIGANLKNYSGDWICETCGNKRYSGGSWLDASAAATAYMMDPRNSIYYADVFQFLELSYDEKTSYSSDIIKKILKGTFLDDGNLDSYIKTILTESKNQNVNPYFIAVKIIQEQGTKGGSTFKMASGELSSEKIQLDEANKVIKVIANTTPKDINEFLNKNYKVKDLNKKEIKENAVMATGYTTDSNYTIVVLGDVNRDGKVKATDYMSIKNYIMGSAKLDKYQLLAADANLDSKVKATDYMTIKNFIMGTTKLQFEKTDYYYNIFNINATGSTVSDILKNALSWAKSKDWNTIEKCLKGGVEFVAKGYIAVGQDTLYFEKFDVIADSYYSHQYAQDVLYAQNQGTRLRKILEGIDATEFAYTFVIPLYEDMPANACLRPKT